EEVRADEIWDAGSPVDIAPGHGDTSVRVRVLVHGIDRTGRTTPLVPVQALAPAPSEVHAPGARLCEVDLLVGVLPDVADPHVARRAIEREPPRVAKTPIPDLGSS